MAFEQCAVDIVTADLDHLQAMLDESADLKRFVASPVFSAEDQLKAIVAISEKAGISGFFANFL
ncbi:F0F1 ATP synthase subunit delta, partial [Rhizobium johnstonii]|uniref:F0F1 ATP synthase subunit delta n=1 Tax=Rhizobium johnstonii TaxID=3019933 RepID=UPI003F9B5374